MSAFGSLERTTQETTKQIPGARIYNATVLEGACTGTKDWRLLVQSGAKQHNDDSDLKICLAVQGNKVDCQDLSHSNFTAISIIMIWLLSRTGLFIFSIRYHTVLRTKALYSSEISISNIDSAKLTTSQSGRFRNEFGMLDCKRTISCGILPKWKIWSIP